MIEIDEDSFINIEVSRDKKLNLSFKTKKDDRTTVVLTAKLDSELLNELIAQLVSAKSRVN